MKRVIIVESPTKARTFNRILKDNGEYEVVASVGHFRDMPSDSLHIHYDDNFRPDYTISAGKEKIVKKLIEVGKNADEIILATDEDREGESISYHIAYVMGFVKENWPEFTLTKKLKRIVFHEITPKALLEALANPQELRTSLVKAQQARRVLDRIVGYEISPLLWKKLGKNWLSAGRVQTVGLRLIVEREKEIKNFLIENYYQIDGNFKIAENIDVKSRLVAKNDEIYEQKTKLSLFSGEYEYVKTSINEKRAEEIKSELSNDIFEVNKVTLTDGVKYPPPPYTTSSLQIDAYRKFGFVAKYTMKLAQTLYERGLITYHRTDSFNLSAGFVFGAKDYITKEFGPEYALPKPRGFRTKSKGAQQAHEAIRPTKVERDPDEVKQAGKASGDILKLYQLIFERAVATQMMEAKTTNCMVTIISKKGFRFETHFERIDFAGFLLLADPEKVKLQKTLPDIKEKADIKLLELESIESKTRPPWRYNDGSLIRALEEAGIGRPSTYASIISHIIDKQYAYRERGYFVPSGLGWTISDYLSTKFTDLFELAFTAQLEEKLDDIADDRIEMIEVLKEFFTPFKKQLDQNMESKESIQVKEDFIDENCPNCGNPLAIKFGRYGKFTACSNYPNCKYIKKDLKFVEGEVCPLDKGRLVVRFSAKIRRRFFGCENYPKCTYTTFMLGDKKSDGVATSNKKSSAPPIKPKKVTKTKSKKTKSRSTK